MLPPALLSVWPPVGDTPAALALLGALEEQWLLLAADVDSGRSTTPSPTAPPTGRCPTSAPSSGCRRTRAVREIAYATALRRRKGTPSALEDFAEVVTGWPSRA